MENFSVLNRDKQINHIITTKFDLAVIGGGITGAGIALDAASRGLNVCLIEKNDFASGTSNKSTKLIHGGLRYLKQFEINLVRESGSERAILHQLAPHLVTPEKMLLPLIKGGNYGKFMTAIGLKVYDFLAGVRGTDKRQMLNKKETLKKEPLLNPKKVVGGGFYAEYKTDDARLTIEILKKAASFGATIINYCEITSFNYNTSSKIESLNGLDANSQKTLKVQAQHYISAVGPWVDTLRKKDTSINNKYLHLTKGVHLVFSAHKLPIKQSVYFDAPDGRMIFAIPRGNKTYVGTTDTNYSGNYDRIVATKKDANYLLDAINNNFPSIQLHIIDIESNWAGLRPLIHEAKKDPSELSRKDEIFVSKSGLISIAGGKLTGYRKMAHRALAAVEKNMSVKLKQKLKPSYTEVIKLVSPTLHSNEDVTAYQKKVEKKLSNLGVKNACNHALYLCLNYGKQADIILDKMKTFNSANHQDALIKAELWFGVQHEMVNSLTDFFVRRTGRLYFDIESVNTNLDVVLKDCIAYFNWDSNRAESEVEKLKRLITDATTYYDKPF